MQTRLRCTLSIFMGKKKKKNRGYPEVGRLSMWQATSGGTWRILFSLPDNTPYPPSDANRWQCNWHRHFNRLSLLLAHGLPVSVAPL